MEELIRSDNLREVASLVMSGFDINSIDAIEYASSPEMLDFVLRLGADPNRYTLPLARVIINRVNRGDAYDFAKILLRAGADPNLQDRRGNTVLMKLFSKIKLLLTRSQPGEVGRVVDLLNDYGADMDLENDRGETARDMLNKIKDHPFYGGILKEESLI